MDRKEYVSVQEVLAEFALWREGGGQADVVTLSGSGEPTLHSRFGDVLTSVRETSGIRTALLTNGSLLFLPEVREAAALADLVKVSLGAWDQASLEKLVRPHRGLVFDRFLDGIRVFRRAFEGEFWIEVFVVPGVNDEPDDLRRIAAVVEDLCPDKIHLNTAVRPPAEPGVRAVGLDCLNDFAGLFTPRAEGLPEKNTDVDTSDAVGERPVQC